MWNSHFWYVAYNLQLDTRIFSKTAILSRIQSPQPKAYPHLEAEDITIQQDEDVPVLYALVYTASPERKGSSVLPST